MAGKSYWLFVDFNLSIFNVNLFTPAQFYFYLSYLITIKEHSQQSSADLGFQRCTFVNFRS